LWAISHALQASIRGKRVIREDRFVCEGGSNASYMGLRVRSVMSVLSCNLYFPIIVDNAPIVAGPRFFSSIWRGFPSKIMVLLLSWYECVRMCVRRILSYASIPSKWCHSGFNPNE